MISPFFIPHIGGSQRFMEELAFHTMNIFSNVTVDVLTYNTEQAVNFQEYRGMRIYRIPCIQLLHGQFALPNPIALLIILRNLHKNNYSHVHTNTRFFESSWWAWIFARIIGAKSIITDHVAGHPIHKRNVISMIARLIDTTIAKYSLNAYGIITATNKKTSKFLKQILHIQKPIELLYGGIDTEFFTPGKRNSPRHIPKCEKVFEKNDLIVTYSGRLIWSKGVTFLLEAIIQGLPSFPNHTYFILAGNGPLTKLIQKTIQINNLEQRIFFLGALQTNEVQKLLAETDIFVHPSCHTEGFPNSILEAGSSECYVIATDNAGTDEIISSETGTFIAQKNSKDIYNAINWAIYHQSECKQKSILLREFIVKHFDWKTIAKQYYNTILLR
jgi:glycosyltransferase involved in cell wall biosynthesis